MTLLRRLALALASIALVFTGVTPASADSANGRSPATSGHGCSATLHQNDRRLGPRILSNTGLTGAELKGYRRTGTLSATKFLETYWNAAANGGAGSWIYPEDDGYLNDAAGDPIKWVQELQAGQYIDRYGSEYGSFLAPTGIPYSTRSIPPANLVGTPAEGCNYSNYKVVKAFSVYAGPIAPWFAQPGYGTQYQLDRSLLDNPPAQLNVLWLVTAGYLERVPTEPQGSSPRSAS